MSVHMAGSRFGFICEILVEGWGGGREEESEKELWQKLSPRSCQQIIYNNIITTHVKLESSVSIPHATVLSMSSVVSEH